MSEFQATESTSTSESASASTAAATNSTQTTTSSPEANSNATSADSKSAPTPTPYNPNFKFKVMDQEKEFDEWIRPVVKDAETEKKLRELYEKAHGLDYVKSGREKLQNDFNNVRTEHTNLRKQVDRLGSYLQKGDLRSFFGELKVPKQLVYQHVLNELKYEEMPPDQKAIVEKQRQDEERARQLEEENSAWKQRYQETSVRSLETELNYTLQRPEVAQIAQQFDSRIGAGAFRSEVIKQGQWFYSVHGQHLPVEQAVQNVMRLIAAQSPAATQAQAAPVAQPAGAVTPDSVPQDKKPIIPNIQGRGTSPAKKSVNSVKALKELAKQKLA